MPITYTEKDGWSINKATKAEQKAIAEIGKRMIIEGLAGSYTNERYKKWLADAKISDCFKV